MNLPGYIGNPDVLPFAKKPLMPKPAVPVAALPRYVAFFRGKRVIEGSEAEVSAYLANQSAASVPSQGSDMPLVFDLLSGEQIEIPVAGAVNADPPASPPRPGRPRLGVVAREVTLLPHDWDWLSQQPGGASVTLRKLVLKARRLSEGPDQVRAAQIVCYRFISAIAGNEPGYEEACRALFSVQEDKFHRCLELWPDDVRRHATQLAQAVFTPAEPLADLAPHPDTTP